MITLKRTQLGYEYATPQGGTVHILRFDGVRNGEWGRYKVGQGRKAHYFSTLRDVRDYLNTKYGTEMCNG